MKSFVSYEICCSQRQLDKFCLNDKTFCKLHPQLVENDEIGLRIEIAESRSKLKHLLIKKNVFPVIN